MDSSDEDRVQDEKDAGWEKKNLRYGWGRFTPNCLQVFNTINWYIFWVCLFSLFQGFIVNGVVNAVITTLESRFELPSSKSGLIASSNDFLALFLVLIISFYGSRRHKPKMIGIGVIVLGIGSLIFSLPHFATGLYSYSGRELGDFDNICRHDNSTNTECTSIAGHHSSLSSYLFVFILANALHGAGSTPMFTLGTTYIDENTRAEQTPLFLGIIYCVASIGVAAGYMTGGQFLNLFTDIDKIDTATLDITPMDPRWVGAWWIPFLITCGLMMLISIPILGYPKRLPGSAKLQLSRVSEVANTKGSERVQRPGFGRSWRDFPRAMFNLARNPTFLCLSLGGCTEGMIISGIATFGAKFLQEKFNLPASLAGFVIERTDPSKLDHECNIGCGCSQKTYEPVCGLDGAIYFSPCHAGCGDDFEMLIGPMGPFKMYKNCSCVMARMQHLLMSTNSTVVMTTTSPITTVSMETNMSESSENITGPPIGAFQGICMSDCKMLYVVAPLLFIGLCLTFMTCSPTQTATMRCVQPNQRSLAIGFQWLFLRILGTLPGPLMLGSIMDSACQVWQEVCGEPGHCWIYKKTSMGTKLFIWWILVKIVAIIFYALAHYFYTPPKVKFVEKCKVPSGLDGENELQDKLVNCKDSVI